MNDLSVIKQGGRLVFVIFVLNHFFVWMSEKHVRIIYPKVIKCVFQICFVEILPLCQTQASAVMCPSTLQRCCLTVKCSNTTGPLAEVEAEWQRATAQSDPEVSKKWN